MYIIVFSIVDYASAQTSCVISPRNLTALRIRNPLEAHVEFKCQCMDDNEMILNGTRWFLPNGNLVSEGSQNGPYYESSAPGTLRIMSFNDSYTGTYTCSPTNTSSAVPPGDTIALSAGPSEILLCM